MDGCGQARYRVSTEDRTYYLQTQPTLALCGPEASEHLNAKC